MHANNRRSGNRHRYLLDAILNFEWCRLGRGLTYALGAWVRSLVLRVVYLARVWDDVSAEWRGEGLLGSGLYETKISRYGGVRCECDLAWIFGGWVHCKCALSVDGSFLINFGCDGRSLRASKASTQIFCVACLNSTPVSLFRREKSQRLGPNEVSRLGVRFPSLFWMSILLNSLFSDYFYNISSRFYATNWRIYHECAI